MKNGYYYLNAEKMMSLSKIMDGSEIKMLFGIIYCLNNTGTEWFLNNADNRSLLAQIGFSKSPERYSSLLSSMTKKGILKRKGNGVYSVVEELIILP